MRTTPLFLALMAVSPAAAAQDAGLEGASRPDWENARQTRLRRVPSNRDVIGTAFRRAADDVTRHWDRAVDAVDRIVGESRLLDDVREQATLLQVQSARFTEDWIPIASDIDRLADALERRTWEDEIDRLNGVVDRMQSGADTVAATLPALGRDLKSALEGVEDALEALDDLADEWDGQIGNDDDDIDDWDGG